MENKKVKVEDIPKGGIKNLKYNWIPTIIATLLMLIFIYLIVNRLITRSIVIAMKNPEVISITVLILSILFELFMVTLLIKLILSKIHLSALLKDGKIIKNLPYEEDKRFSLYKLFINSAIPVKAEYTDKEGNIHIFKGFIFEREVEDSKICDVLYNKKTYKEYILRKTIS